eukprot:Gregarina_sp_Poly_1__3418@NODE_1992_length_2915_cov_119_110955_g1286_i0_p2_GENE_NODE_1992_length_2915_cov_119_110955_g1286_i0NODE_1992_length_2915_cov_119_110955_g1286_i0_p2_ORF_typecomplete_len220_score27_09zfRRPl_C4/PF17026_5/0_11_NODE_1992_length_2915_cov_119_110955_g1286_i07551414
MKGIQVEQKKSSQSSGLLCNALVSCLQALEGDEQHAIQCESTKEPIAALGICQYLLESKKASLETNFEWSSNRHIQIVDREKYEPARIELGSNNSVHKEALIKILGKTIFQCMRHRGLKLVEQEDMSLLEKAAHELRHSWSEFPKVNALALQLLTDPFESKDIYVNFFDYQALSLRRKPGATPEQENQSPNVYLSEKKNAEVAPSKKRSKSSKRKQTKF